MHANHRPHPVIILSCASTLFIATALAACPPQESDPAVTVTPVVEVVAAPAAVPGSGGGGLVAAVEPKPLTENVHKALEWLVAHQHNSGGWGQGEEAANMGSGMDHLREQPNVADTCAAMLALIRSGSTPSEGPHSTALRRAFEFVAAQIEASDADSLSITSINGTRVQGKLGQYIDTFLASVVLPELKGRMPDEASEQRLGAALIKVLHKIEHNQQKDGTWKNDGWAPLLAQSMAAKGLNRASQWGMAVDAEALARNGEQARGQINGGGGGMGGGGVGGLASDGAAGIQLYSIAANLSQIQDNVNTNDQRAAEVTRVANDPAAKPEDRQAAEQELERFRLVAEACDTAQATVVQRMDDPQFIAGFGSNGGEEFLSYMNIGESLVVKGGENWNTWDTKMTANINRIQNADGSWTGHHCITGRTFCTATALLTLLVDRTPIPAEVKAQANAAGAE